VASVVAQASQWRMLSPAAAFAVRTQAPEFAAMKKNAPEAAPPVAPAVKKAKPRKATATVEAPPPVVAPEPRKSTADLLREALAAKNAGPATGAPRLRPQMGGGKVAKDAERRSGKSRKVH
jgi:hypothetical protein